MYYSRCYAQNFIKIYEILAGTLTHTCACCMHVHFPCMKPCHAGLTLSPSLVLKLWKMRWGKASDIVPTLGISCLITVLESEKEAVGPYGRWHTTRPSWEGGVVNRKKEGVKGKRVGRGR